MIAGRLRDWLIALALTAAVASWGNLAWAYSRTLTPEEIQAAVEYGKGRRGKDIADAGSPYMPNLTGPISGGFLLIETPWLKVASVARKAAAEYREPTPEEIQAAIALSAGKLGVTAFVADSSDNFWRDSHGVIQQAAADGMQTIQPTSKSSAFVQVVTCRTTPCTVAAVITLVFPDERVNPAGEAEFVIILRGGYKEARAKVNLAALR